jgi:hypothetical protein
MKGDKKSRAGLTLPGGHQIKEAWALDQIVCFLGIDPIPISPTSAERALERRWRWSPLDKKRIDHAN